ncbi:hypothetical protein PG999_007669 [Apiospora kogelbergensis]|uniref:Sulfatase N-terminal domain-containing protein n=1 Tax=Apiospora kogelbergensis TaxID=1337665 RepID=A0AAW0QMV1_9PEZI
MIMTDDQDLYLDSLEHMAAVQKHLVEKGTTFSNHWVTDAQCCPSRATVLRGQQAHNTNITAVRYPGGNYDKWLASGMDGDYLPNWLNDAGYSTNYIGKLLNDALLEPYMYDFNRAVFSKNGGHPVTYPGWHQTDIIRIKAIERIRELAKEDKPFFYWIAPTAPHTPLARHNETFADLTLPKKGNWNPADEYAKQKVNWVGKLKPLNESMLVQTEGLHRARIQTLQGIDEMVQDIVAVLDETGLLEDTYVIYTSDNGYMIGTHRIPAVKTLAYKEAGQTPFIVRGPGILPNATSRLPGTHTDLAPTLLDIAGVQAKDFPELFDGRSLLSQWHNPNGVCTDEAEKVKLDNDLIGVEFWGDADIELPTLSSKDSPTSYTRILTTFKALRIVGEHRAYLYTVWCTGELELYNTIDDPDELVNLALNPSEDTRRLMSRLNALLLVLKSCEGAMCRDPWMAFTDDTVDKSLPSRFDTLESALDPTFDDYFSQLPKVQFNQCLRVQSVENEMPFFPQEASKGLGSAWRIMMDDWASPEFKPAARVPNNTFPAGGLEQRTASYSELSAAMRELTKIELDG